MTENKLTETLHKLRMDDSAEYFWMTTEAYVDDEILSLRGACL